MSKTLVYIDQNIIGLQQQGLINLSEQEDLIWVYSKEHFREIRRSENPEKYLGVLNALNAKMLDLILDENWKITGEARLIEYETPYQNYTNYLEAIGDVQFDETIFDSFQVWVNGGGDEGPLREISDKFALQILELTSGLPFDTTEITRKAESSKSGFDAMVEKLILTGNSIEKTRAAFGDEKGSIGGISGEQQIKQIWEIISPAISTANISCDQFFGFDPIDKQGYESWPIYLGIIGCNAVMDILGFQAEKKCRKINKIHNVRSDAGHIAMGAYCSAILSGDRRLVKRAKAIYEYKDIRTLPTLIEKKTENSIKPTSKAD